MPATSPFIFRCLSCDPPQLLSCPSKTNSSQPLQRLSTKPWGAIAKFVSTRTHLSPPPCHQYLPLLFPPKIGRNLSGSQLTRLSITLGLQAHLRITRIQSKLSLHSAPNTTFPISLSFPPPTTLFALSLPVNRTASHSRLLKIMYPVYVRGTFVMATPSPGQIASTSSLVLLVL